MAGWTYAGLDTGSVHWTTAGGSTSTGARTLPADMERAVVEKVRGWWERRSGLRSRSVGDLSVTYASETEGPGPAEALLGPYRRIA